MSSVNKESALLYADYGNYLKTVFPWKVQKISINAGFTCPNRDGSKGWGGCTYCNNQTFSPDYCHTGKSVTQQLDEGISFFGRKYPDMRYLAYFQAYTNSYGEMEVLVAKYEEAVRHSQVVGLIIGTRPDCMTDELLRYLHSLSQSCYVMIEYGVESVHDATLLRINRGHDYRSVADAVERTHQMGIASGAHLILGLPGETHEMMMQTARTLSLLPVTTLKLHQLQLIKNTRMALEYEQSPSDFTAYNVDEYIDLAIDFVEQMRPDIVIERFVSQSPQELLIAPHWGLKNYQFTARLLRRMQERHTYQGRLWEESTQGLNE